MRVTVRVFARLKELAGRSEWICELGPHASVQDAWQASVREHENLAPFAKSVSCAINARFARMNADVADGDEVAFLPPVSGG